MCGLLLLAAGACSQPPPAPGPLRQPAPEPAQPGALCADVAAQRVCWQAAEPSLVPRVVPEVPGPRDGWRCGGSGAERVCEDRGRNAGRFSCGSQRCLQLRPRMPDDGEWECVELHGAVFCHSRGPLAGMDSGPMDLGWLCGARRRAAGGERICVDLDADRPNPHEPFSCRYELQHGIAVRSCAAARGLVLGSACAGQTCPEGTACRAGLCLPARPEPACWLDADCDAGERCVLGSCAQRSARGSG